jgi:hypothetical protein
MRRVLLGKLIVAQLAKKLSAIYVTRRLIIVFSRAPEPLESSPQPYILFLRSILIVSPHIYLRILSGLFLLGIPIKILYAFVISAVCTTCPAHLISFDLISLIQGHRKVTQHILKYLLIIAIQYNSIGLINTHIAVTMQEPMQVTSCCSRQYLVWWTVPGHCRNSSPVCIKHEEKSEYMHHWTRWTLSAVYITLFSVFWFQCNLFFDKQNMCQEWVAWLFDHSLVFGEEFVLWNSSSCIPPLLCLNFRLFSLRFDFLSPSPSLFKVRTKINTHNKFI